MPKGERSKLQLIPPVGITSDSWNGKRNSSGPPSKHKVGRFSMNCVVDGCEYRRKDVNTGVDRPRFCPNGHEYPVNGWVR